MVWLLICQYISLNLFSFSSLINCHFFPFFLSFFLLFFFFFSNAIFTFLLTWHAGKYKQKIKPKQYLSFIPFLGMLQAQKRKCCWAIFPQYCHFKPQLCITFSSGVGTLKNKYFPELYLEATIYLHSNSFVGIKTDLNPFNPYPPG